jgi:hypothetical protein
LLIAVYDQIMNEIALAVAHSTAPESTIEAQARAGMRASWEIYTSDRRKARVIALEAVGVSERLERMRRERRHAFADLLVQNALSLADEGVHLKLDPVLISRALMGGVVAILTDWINGDIDVSADEIAEHFTRLFTVASYEAIGRIPPLDDAAVDGRETTSEVRTGDERQPANGRHAANGRRARNGPQATNGRRAKGNR